MSFLLIATAGSLTGLDSRVEYFLIFFAASAAIILVGRIVVAASSHPKLSKGSNGLATFGKFFYASFLKPYSGDDATTGQQAALESFYKAQVRLFRQSHRTCELSTRVFVRKKLASTACSSTILQKYSR